MRPPLADRTLLYPLKIAKLELSLSARGPSEVARAPSGMEFTHYGL